MGGPASGPSSRRALARRGPLVARRCVTSTGAGLSPYRAALQGAHVVRTAHPAPRSGGSPAIRGRTEPRLRRGRRGSKPSDFAPKHGHCGPTGSPRPRWRARWVAQRGMLGAWSAAWLTVTVGRHRAPDGLGGAYIAVANHSSHLDAPLSSRAAAPPRPLPRRRRRRRLLLRRVVAQGAHRPVLQRVPGRPRRLSARVEARSAARRGVPLLVFPEGTRSKTGQHRPLQGRGRALATAPNVPCVPVAIVGADTPIREARSGRRAGCRSAWSSGSPMRPPARPGDFMRRVRGEVQRLHDETIGPDRRRPSVHRLRGAER